MHIVNIQVLLFSQNLSQIIMYKVPMKLISFNSFQFLYFRNSVFE